jgi:hypothetical protein
MIGACRINDVIGAKIESYFAWGTQVYKVHVHTKAGGLTYGYAKTHHPIFGDESP